MSEPLAHVTDEDFLRVRARQTDDLWGRYEAPDQGAARRWLHEKLLAGHAYGRHVGGTPELLERITLFQQPTHGRIVTSKRLPSAAKPLQPGCCWLIPNWPADGATWRASSPQSKLRIEHRVDNVIGRRHRALAHVDHALHRLLLLSRTCGGRLSTSGLRALVDSV